VEKTSGKKSRATVPLTQICLVEVKMPSLSNAYPGGWGVYDFQNFDIGLSNENF
jgi:hypothetical protein